MPSETRTPSENCELAARVARAEKVAVARALNSIEDRRAGSREHVEDLLQLLAKARAASFGHRIGLTGPPGVGKSTLTASLARTYRPRGLRVGVLAVDPSSMRSGGALLGDRARMAFDPEDDGLFVRSLATAGDTGGLAYAAHAGMEVLATAYERVLIETVGVGQSETDIEHVVDTVCLVIQPGSGDVLQFIKAGIMEIPDVIVVNKGDHGKMAQRAAADLRGALERLRSAGMADAGSSRPLPVMVTSARDRVGIDELVDALEAQRASFSDEALLQRRHRGQIAWAAALFNRRFGEHGVSSLGGAAAVRAEIEHALVAGGTSVGAVRLLGERYLAGLRGH